jgi:hypothetical protein
VTCVFELVRARARLGRRPGGRRGGLFLEVVFVINRTPPSEVSILSRKSLIRGQQVLDVAATKFASQVKSSYT